MGCTHSSSAVVFDANRGAASSSLHAESSFALKEHKQDDEERQKQEQHQRLKRSLRDNLLVMKRLDFRHDYTVNKLIGSGSISNVYLVTRKWRSFLQGTPSMREFKKEYLDCMLVPGAEDNDYHISKNTACDESSLATTTAESCSASFTAGSGGCSYNHHGSVASAAAAVAPLNHCYAVKEIDVDLLDVHSLQEMKNEIDLLRQIDHPNVVKAYEVYCSGDDHSDTTEEEHHHHHRLSLVMEYCSGGDLNERGPYNEEQAQAIIRKILEALNYLHKNGIMHCDLKFENIMFENETPDAEIKLVDFGLSKRYNTNNNHQGGGEKFADTVGTVYTMAPEVIRGNYDSQADLWSVGVIAYQLLSGGRRPFWSEESMELAQKILTGKYPSMEGPEWKDVSWQAKEFVQRLLLVQPILRYTAEKALKSQWLKKTRFGCSGRERANSIDRSITSSCSSIASGYSSDDGSIAESSTIPKRISREEPPSWISASCLAECSEFRKLAMQTVAHKVGRDASSAPQVVAVRQLFHTIDANHDGMITLDEMVKALGGSRRRRSSIGKQHEIEAWFRQADVGGRGKLDYSEFLAAALLGIAAETKIACNSLSVTPEIGVNDASEEESLSEENRKEGADDQREQEQLQLDMILATCVAESFQVLDHDDKGFLTANDLRRILGFADGDAPRAEDILFIHSLVRQADANGDGKISFTEFRDAMLGISQVPSIGTKQKHARIRRTASLDHMVKKKPSADVEDVGPSRHQRARTLSH